MQPFLFASNLYFISKVKHSKRNRNDYRTKPRNKPLFRRRNIVVSFLRRIICATSAFFAAAAAFFAAAAAANEVAWFVNRRSYHGVPEIFYMR